MTYKYLTKQQSDIVKKHYKHQDSLEKIVYFFSKTKNELGIKANFVSYATLIIDADFFDMEDNILIFGEGDNKKFFSDFDTEEEFSLGLEKALEIIDSVLAWLECTKQKQLNQQVLKANYLLDVLMREDNQYYLGQTEVEYDEGALEELSSEKQAEVQKRLNVYSQMFAEITEGYFQIQVSKGAYDVWADFVKITNQPVKKLLEEAPEIVKIIKE